MEHSNSSEPEEEDEDDGLQRLFFSCSSSSCDDDSEIEWREAIRQALEADIQYQVRLRLALDSPQLRTTGAENCSKQEQQTLELFPQRRAIVRVDHDDMQEAKREETKDELPEQLLHEVGGAGQEKSEEQVEYVTKLPKLLEKISDAASLQQQKAVDSPVVVVEVKQSTDEKTVGGADSRLKQLQQAQTVFDYLHLKYGTPYHQLEHLANHGCFKCINGEREPVDSRMKWPKERHIVTSAPQLVSTEAAQTVSETTDFSQVPSVDAQCSSIGIPVYDCSMVDDSVENDQDGANDRKCAGETSKLRFESRFESGNLYQAMQVGPCSYHLLLNNDLYTQRHTQWFYYKVTNMEEGRTYTFSILNLRKKDSLYNHGMKVLMYSETAKGWTRVGRNISYRRLTHRNHKTLRHDTEYFCLTWTMEFPHTADTCYFAHCYPYTYTHLLDQLDTLIQDPQQGQYIRKEELCQTIGGNSCPLLTIADFGAPEEEWCERMGVVMSARVHPGESNSSWIMQGVINYLTSEHKHAKYLRSQYVFKLIPMLNPDGVIVGNYRTSLVGVDLNRVFKGPIQKLFPTVYNTKKMIQQFAERRELACYIDVHGHSRNHNVFMYGCHTTDCDHATFLRERVVPWLLSQLSREKFCFRSCKFNVQRCKISTGRVQVWKMGIANSFTMEASFCGSTLNRAGPGHFTQADLLNMGEEVCEMLLRLRKYYKSNSYQHKIHCELAEYYTTQQQQKAAERDCPVLPDIVTSTTQQASKDEREDREKERDKRHRMSRCLRRFYRMKIQNLEEESSTSGSDSDNDEFKFGRNKSKHQHSQRQHRQKQRQKRQQIHRSTQPVQIKQPTKEQEKMPEQERLLKELSHSSSRREQPVAKEKLKMSSSAPPRLQRESHQPHGWRFVNRYANRSNGGIPCFSEERSKERAEKKLKSLSTIETGSLPPLAAGTTPAASSQYHLHKPTSSAPSQQLWAPPADSRTRRSQSSSTVLSANSQQLLPAVSSLGNSLLHYKKIKGLVESQRHIPNAQLPSSSLASFKPTPRKLPKLPTLPPPIPPPHTRTPAAGNPPLPSGIGLPPHLLRYISEIWQKQLRST